MSRDQLSISLYTDITILNLLFHPAKLQKLFHIQPYEAKNLHPFSPYLFIPLPLPRILK
ncbi:hypothetical protein HMPREF1551_01614 [Capnocytophaga sp. oral taxon 863 str. F0517]|nr:hypothetical protein HMPREF1551_01614 [Capnocytophaga sp. oral taxon 863 str. F0517]